MAAVDSSLYQHPLDRQMLAALKKVPLFDTFMKAFMKMFSERSMFIENCSTNIEITERQLPEIYEKLPPICEKLGIAVPRLFLANERDINAHTSGDNNPFIVLNSGTIECCSDEDITGILAHECGHIACHHVLYQTIGSIILSGAINFLPGIGKLASVGLQVAFYRWMKASEYSADRACALVMGGSKGAVGVLTSIAGGYKALGFEIDDELFLEQAVAYEQSIKDSFTNQFFEGWNYGSSSHPQNSYRALEVARWCLTPEFERLQEILESPASSVPLPPPMQTTQVDVQIDITQQAAPARAGALPQFGNAIKNAVAPLRSAAPQPQIAQPQMAQPQTTKKFCAKCGSPVVPGNEFCVNCGSRY